MIDHPTIFPARLSRLSRGRRGFTLTEIAIVLGIVTSIIAAIWVAAGQVNEKSRVTQAMNQFSAITQNMSAMFQGGFGISGTPCTAPCDMTAAMMTSGVIPIWMGTTAPPNTPWSNGGVYLRWVSAAPPTYRISFYGVTHDGCLGLIMATTSCTPGQPGCPTKVETKGTAAAVGTYAAPGATATYPPMTSSNAEIACNANSYSGAPNSVEFEFTQ